MRVHLVRRLLLHPVCGRLHVAHRQVGHVGTRHLHSHVIDGEVVDAEHGQGGHGELADTRRHVAEHRAVVVERTAEAVWLEMGKSMLCRRSGLQHVES